MGRLSWVLVAVMAATGVGTSTADDVCEPWELAAGLCGSENQGDHTDIYAEIAAGDLSQPRDSNDKIFVIAETQPDAPAMLAPLRPDDCSPEVRETCAGDPTVEPVPEVPGAVVVTMRDIASFRPAKPGNGMEPGGWAIEDLAANFVAAASVEVVPGTLLGQPAEVRFTPLGYRWTHSDGAVVESPQPGASWAALGMREFSPTGTSHAYAESGEYTVALEVVLGAEYRFAGSGWRTIAGTLTVAGDPQRVLVGQFDTVLTQGDCNAYPNGPGC